jgi:hypothetical protein
MRHREPPPLATWMLTHLTAWDRDEALDGDLFEMFQLGRSDAWYWRQVTVACFLSWWSNLNARRAPLAFAFLWSMLAPVWYSILERIDTSQNFEKGNQIFGPFWLPLVLVIWVVLHAAFLWAGILVYRIANMMLSRTPRSDDLRPAFWIAALILPPVYGLSFVFATLYRYSVPGLAGAKLATTAWGQVSDLGILTNLIRIPYFVAMAAALWGTVHNSRNVQNSASFDFLSQRAPSEPNATYDSQSIQRSLALMVGAGLVNCLIAALFFCHLPDSDSISLASLFARALRFILIGALGGITGSWLYWKSPASPLRKGSPLPFWLFALTCTAGWIWVPALILFAEQVSSAAAFVAMIGAFALATALRTETWFVLEPAQPNRPQWDEDELFAGALYRPPSEPYGYLVAFCLFAAGAAFATHSMYTATLTLAASAFVFAWRNTFPRPEASSLPLKRGIRRVAIAVLPATLLTFWALLNGISHRSAAMQANAVGEAARSGPTPSADPKAPITTSGAGGYESVVLWPFPRKKEIVPPLTLNNSILKPGTKRPLIIRFDGPYWFLQPPLKSPGPRAHVAKGTPMSVDLQSNNAIALVMNAHQKLAQPIPLARCREIDVDIENRDNKPGLISLGLFLIDERSSPKRTLYIGQQPIASTEHANFFVKTSPAYETIRFPVPSDASLREFDEITLMFLPDIEHTFVAPKIAIQQFELFAR